MFPHPLVEVLSFDTLAVLLITILLTLLLILLIHTFAPH